MLAILGAWHLFDDTVHPTGIQSLLCRIEFLNTYPDGEASGCWAPFSSVLPGPKLFTADLGHCGKGQYPHLLDLCKDLPAAQLSRTRSIPPETPIAVSRSPQLLTESMGINAFYDLMPQWFVIVGVVIATTAAIIASQAMVSGLLYPNQ